MLITPTTCRPLRPAGAVALATFALLWPGAAPAHQIWLEQDKAGAKLYFGEFGENVRESSPGYLDKFPGPTATHLTAKGEAAVAPAKTATGFAIAAQIRKGETLIAQEPSYPVIERKAGEKTTRTFWSPAARYIADFSPQPAKLTLDVVPTGKSGELQVVFRGQPLPKAEVAITAVSGWGQQGRTDEQGKVAFSFPWKGPYLISVRHVENTPGVRPAAAGKPEEKYDLASFTTTLSFVTSTGLPSPPPPKPPARSGAE